MRPTTFTPAIPASSTVLVTGVNGFIGSHIADQFLKYGYKVRGTSRDPEKHTWLCTLFDKAYGTGQFELVSVPDMEASGAYDDAVKGVSVVVHPATNYSMDSDPHKVVPGALAGVRNALTAAAKEPSVKRFVLTSSSAAALIPRPDEVLTVTTDTWNEDVIKYAYRDPPYELERAYPVYAASKTLAEKEAWKFVEEEKPGFVLNTVLPNLNFGKTLDLANQGHPSTSGLIVELLNGNSAPLSGLPAQYFVDVQDTALLHVAAAIHPSVSHERVFAFAEPINGDTLLTALRRLYPEKKLPENFQSAVDRSVIKPQERAKALLRDMGKNEWTSLEESIRLNTMDVVT